MADNNRPGPTHHSAGEDAISVSELLERHRQLDQAAARDDRVGETMPHRPLASVGEVQSPLDSGQLFITELLRREGRLDEPPPPPPRPARSYRPMVAAAALVLVCGIATAGIAALAGDRDDRPDPDDVTPVAVLRGPDALLPDVILLAIHGPAGVAEAAGDANPAVEGDTDPAQPDPAQAEPGDVLDPETATDPVTGVVTAFFQAAPTSPNDAYELLHETLRGDGIETFNQAWDGVEQVRIDSVRRDGGLVRVALSLVRGDGSTLRVVEEVRVQMDRIVEATLLSAVISR